MATWYPMQAMATYWHDIHDLHVTRQGRAYIHDHYYIIHSQLIQVCYFVLGQPSTLNHAYNLAYSSIQPTYYDGMNSLPSDHYHTTTANARQCPSVNLYSCPLSPMIKFQAQQAQNRGGTNRDYTKLDTSTQDLHGTLDKRICGLLGGDKNEQKLSNLQNPQ